MKAAVFYNTGDLRVEDIAPPVCPPGGAIIKVEAVGICGGDVRTYYYGSHKIKPPMILGHEVAGTIVETGKYFKSYKIDDNIAMAPGIFCNECYYCLHDMRTMCENLTEIGFHYPGAFAEYMSIPEEAFSRGRVVPIPEKLSFEYAALAEPPSSCLYSQERADVCLGDNVVIIGAGPIGCIHMQIAKARGADKVVVIENNSERLNLTKVFDSYLYIDTNKEDPVRKVKDLTNGLGADKVIVAAPSATAQELAIEICRKRGTVVLFGGLAKDDPFSRLNSNIIHYNDISILGHYGQERRHVTQSLELISKNIIDASKLITHILPLNKIIEGFKLINDKKALKVILKPFI